MCVCVRVFVKDAFKLQVNSVTICNGHERRWFIESGDHLGGTEQTRDNLVCLTVSSRHRTFSRSGRCFGCLLCKLLHDKSHRGSGFRGERKELSPGTPNAVGRCPKNCDGHSLTNEAHASRIGHVPLYGQTGSKAFQEMLAFAMDRSVR